MGNICRSPTAEGLFRQLTRHRRVEERFEIDSAGTGGWHIGTAPDERAQQAALLRGIDLSSIRARQVSDDDFAYFDSIIAMDHDNMTRLLNLAPEPHRHKIRLLLDYPSGPGNKAVPDPYYGGDNGFEIVLDLIEDGCENLLGTLLNQ